MASGSVSRCCIIHPGSCSPSAGIYSRATMQLNRHDRHRALTEQKLNVHSIAVNGLLLNMNTFFIFFTFIEKLQNATASAPKKHIYTNIGEDVG
jgi:hypothetical protein